MDLWMSFSIRSAHGLPRTRGDGPLLCRIFSRLAWASPHTRGWTRVGSTRASRSAGFPAHAGMDLRCFSPAPTPERLPRTRGDGPLAAGPVHGDAAASPHTRGWTRVRDLVPAHPDGFPAHAGMDPAADRCRWSSGGLPRTRGDGPERGRCAVRFGAASPHTRGWTLMGSLDFGPGEGFPAHAGMELLAVIERTPACRDRVASRKALTNRGL